MVKYIAILKTYQDILQFAHWNTAKEYASHLLFERLMNDIPDLLDRFVEVYMGSKDTVYVSYDEFKKINIDNKEGGLKEFIQEAKLEFKALLADSDETIQNVVVDILEMFDRHLYLL